MKDLISSDGCCLTHKISSKVILRMMSTALHARPTDQRPLSTPFSQIFRNKILCDLSDLSLEDSWDVGGPADAWDPEKEKAGLSNKLVDTDSSLPKDNQRQESECVPSLPSLTILVRLLSTQSHLIRRLMSEKKRGHFNYSKQIMACEYNLVSI